jgi:fructosamine-3-kinase
MWESIESSISAATDSRFSVESTRPIGGGSINEALCAEGSGQRYFLKLNQPDRLSMFEAEAEGLGALIQSKSLRLPEPIAWGADDNRSWLALEYIEFDTATATTQSVLGERLALMHRTSAESFGWHRDNTIGVTEQPNSWTDDWVTFLKGQRLGFQLSLAEINGAPHSLLDSGQQLLASLDAFFQGYQPSPAMLHGDLWGGNWGCDTAGEPVIFDPAVYFGDREADLAMTELFGGFSEAFYDAYQAAWPLDAGYEERKHLYNLYHVLNHFNLFGGGYAAQAQGLIDRVLIG